MLSFFPRGVLDEILNLIESVVLDEILNLIESVSEGFPFYYFCHKKFQVGPCPNLKDSSFYGTFIVHRYQT